MLNRPALPLLFLLVLIAGLLWFFLIWQDDAGEELTEAGSRPDEANIPSAEARRSTRGGDSAVESGVAPRSEASILSPHAFSDPGAEVRAVIQTTPGRAESLAWQGGTLTGKHLAVKDLEQPPGFGRATDLLEAAMSRAHFRFEIIDPNTDWRPAIEAGLRDGEALSAVVAGPGSLQPLEAITLSKRRMATRPERAAGRFQILDGTKQPVAGIRVEQVLRLSRSAAIVFEARTDRNGQCPALHEPSWFQKVHAAFICCEGESRGRSMATLPIDDLGQRIVYLGTSALKHRLVLRDRGGAPIREAISGTIMTVGRHGEIPFRTSTAGETEVFLPSRPPEVLVSLSDDTRQVVDGESQTEAAIRGRAVVIPAAEPGDGSGGTLEQLPTIVVHLAPPSTLRGRLICRDESFLPEEVILLFSEGRTATPGADGRFELAGLSNRRWRVHAPEGFVFDLPALERRYGEIPVEGATAGAIVTNPLRITASEDLRSLYFQIDDARPEPFLTIVLRRPERLEGRVVVADPGRRPVAGADVFLSLVSEGTSLFRGPDVFLGPFKTDSQGRFEITPRGAGRFVLSAHAEGFPTCFSEVFAIGGRERPSDFLIELASIRLTVEAQARDTTPLDEVSLILTSASNDLRQVLPGRGRVDLKGEKLVEGRRVYEGMAPGRYRLRALHRDRPLIVDGSEVKELILRPGDDPADVRVALRRGHHYRIRIEHPWGQPFAEGDVRFASRDGRMPALEAKADQNGLIELTLAKPHELLVESVKGEVVLAGHFRAAGIFQPINPSIIDPGDETTTVKVRLSSSAR